MSQTMFLDGALAQWAKATPDAEAVRCVGQSVTYAVLQDHVQALADKLSAQGYGRGHRIGVHLDKSIDSLVAVLGVLRAGAGYVPLDPGAPSARLETVTRACDLACVITDARKAESFPLAETSLALLGPDGDVLRGVASPETERLPGPRTPEDTAYVLYTSGSTGTPKGIHHTHQSGLTYARMAAELCALTSTDRVSNHTPFHFDMSIFDIFSAQLAGACTVIIPEMYTKIPASLAKLVEEERLTVWYSVPFALTQMTERGGLDKRDLSALRVVMYAAEKMQAHDLKALADHAPQAIFINAYGPTETNHVTSKILRYDALDGVTPITIGVPTDTAQVVIWDEGRAADRGQLLVATDQAMTGYWNDPERSAAAFVELDAGDGMRRYHATGDLVQRLPNGDLELIGRMDHQIKLRGYRVELGEVEQVMARCPGVAEAVASVGPDGSTLWAFVRQTDGALLDAETLRAHCEAHLPPYAVPAQFEIHEALPRTSTGKIDRTRLLEMTHD